MAIRPNSANTPLGPLATPGASARSPQTSAEPGKSSPARRDAYEPHSAPAPDAPFWLVQMSADRLARRQYLGAAEARAAERVERAWIARLAAAAAPLVAAWAAAWPDPRAIATHQALARALCAAAGDFAIPEVVYQPAIGSKGRGQFLFRVDRGLIQLAPQVAGSRADWAGTLAHETFHHLQQELVSALYQGRPAASNELASLAAYYRDARAIYQTLGPACPPDRHRAQALERGAWAFGRAIAQQLPGAG